ncbi:DUF2510 domain-containing protein [Candidatus Poriferisocius sp.]|uniref:DUF2510 domain-containing protein n=1 Tax=Candidatus Poriferisocius sp. TaxID=3101276 RepID=UPI003B020372
MAVSSWEPDPTGRHQYRWWDGERWTDQVADDGVQSVDPISITEAGLPRDTPPLPPPPPGSARGHRCRTLNQCPRPILDALIEKAALWRLSS